MLSCLQRMLTGLFLGLYFIGPTPTLGRSALPGDESLAVPTNALAPTSQQAPPDTTEPDPDPGEPRVPPDLDPDHPPTAASDRERRRLPDLGLSEPAHSLPVGSLGWHNRVGARVGADLLGGEVFASITPGFNLAMDVLERPLDFTFAIPLRIEIVSARREDAFSHVGRFRFEDWDEPAEYLQLIQHLSWGDRAGHFVLALEQFGKTTVGHGALVRRHTRSLLMNHNHVAFHGRGFSDWVGGEAYLDSVAHPQVVAGRISGHPLRAIDPANLYLRSFTLGATVAADLDAPLRNRLDLRDADDDGRRRSEILLSSSGHPRYVATRVVAYGTDAGIRIVESDSLSYDVYFDYSLLLSALPTDDPDYPGPSFGPAPPPTPFVPRRGVQTSGFTWGNILRVKLGEPATHGLVARVEYRNHEANYQPSWFDLVYSAQRVQFTQAGRAPRDIANRTKVQSVLDREGRRPNGGYLELGYLFSDILTLAVGFEFNDRYPDNSMFLHLEVNKLAGWQFSMTYHRRAARGFVDLWQWFSGGGYDIFVARTRYLIAGVIGLTLESMTPFHLNRANKYVNAWQLSFAIDVGWSFGKLLPKK